MQCELVTSPFLARARWVTVAIIVQFPALVWICKPPTIGRMASRSDACLT